MNVPWAVFGSGMYCMKNCAWDEMRLCGIVLLANGARVLPTVVSGS